MAREINRRYFPKKTFNAQLAHENIYISNYQGNANQNPCHRAISEKTRDNKCWRGCSGKGTVGTAAGDVNWGSHHGSQCGVPQKVKTELPCDLAVPFPVSGVYPQNITIRSQRVSRWLDNDVVTYTVVTRSWGGGGGGRNLERGDE